MDCRHCREQIKIWMIEGGERALPDPIAKHTEDCPGCAATLHAARTLLSGQGLQADTPPYLARRVAAGIQGTRFHRGVRLIPAVAVIAVMIALAGVLAGRWVSRDTVLVQFRIEMPEASSIHVVGDFNGWDTQADPLSDPDGDGIWVTKMRLIPSREYRYQFHIDGSDWIADPTADIRIEDGFGGETSVLQI